MLVLARKVAEEIVIDGRIRISVLGISGGRVRLGIVAPTEIPVRREQAVERTVEEDYPVLAAAAR